MIFVRIIRIIDTNTHEERKILLSIELHCHSRLSDGSTRIEDIINLAEQCGVTTISITDHDTFEGSLKAEAYTGNCGVELIRGIEISAIDNKTGRRVHVLGYMCDKLRDIVAICTKTILSRYTSGRAMVDRIKKDYNLNYKMVEYYSNQSTSVYKQHIMNALMDAGYTDSIYGELYDKLFNSKDGLAYEPIRYPEVREVVRLINESGGLAVIAHCSQFDSFDIINELTNEDLLDGVEVWHPRNTESDKQMLIRFAEEKGLIMTGGTDFHGAYGRTPHTLATITTPEEQLTRMKLRKAQKI